MGVSLGVGGEEGFVPALVSPQRQHVVQPKEVHVDQRVLDVVFRQSAADQVVHGLDAVFFLDRGRDAHRARTAPHDVLLERAVGQLRALEALAVVGHVDVGRIEVRQRVDGVVDAAFAVALERGQQLEREARGAVRRGAAYEFYDVHALFGISCRTSSGVMPRRRA